MYTGYFDKMREELVKVTPLKHCKAEIKHASQKAEFELQEAKRTKMQDRINAARNRGQGGGDYDMFSRTKSAPDASDAGIREPRVMRIRQTAGAQSPPSLDKDELRPMKKPDKAKLQRNHTTVGVFADKSGKKTASDRYNEMAQPLIGMLGNSPKERKCTPKKDSSDDQFSDASSEDTSAVTDVGFSRTQSAPAVAAASPQRRGDEVKEIYIPKPEPGPMFSRTQSAPESGYIKEEFSRLPSATSEEMPGYY